MRIARVLTRLNLGGPARQALAADRQFGLRGHEVRVFTGRPEPGEGDLFEEFKRADIDVRRVPGLGRGLSLGGDLVALVSLSRSLREFAPDVLHTHASKAGALGRLALSGEAPRARVHTFHGHVLEGYFGPHISRALVLAERKLAQRCQRVLAVSHATADDLLRLGIVEEERLVVCPPGLELSDLLAIEGREGSLRRQIGAGEADFVVGVVGRLAEVKCPERAVDVFLMLAKKHPRLQLAFVGDGGLRRMLEGRIRALPQEYTSRVHILGARSGMPAVLSDLDCVLCTSRSEGLPVALIEAAAAGKPVVASAVGGVAELVAHERTGYLGQGTDELAYGLDQLLESPAACADMGRRARLRVAERHGARALADRLEAIYAAALAESGGKQPRLA